MDNMINIANQIIVYSVCYTLIFVVYGYMFYHVFKFIAQIVIYTYKKLTADCRKWRSGKYHQAGGMKEYNLSAACLVERTS